MITAKKGALAYTLKLPTNWHIHPTFNKALLTPYTPPTFPNQEQPLPPPPDLIEGAEHYEVEKVLDSRLQKVWGKQGEPPKRVTDYFIKWNGYGPESNSWIWEDHMDTDELIEEFLMEHVDLVVTSNPKATIVINAKHPNRQGPWEEWQYLIHPGDDPQYGPQVEMWFYTHQVPLYLWLIQEYWEVNTEDEKYDYNEPYQADIVNDWSGP